MEFWQQLALAALGGGVVTGIVVSLLNNWLESMRDDRRWKREKEERREQWEREREEREKQREWMLQDDIRQQRREWRQERLEPVLQFLDGLAVFNAALKVYSVAERARTDSDGAKARVEELELQIGEICERARGSVFTEGFKIIAGIDDIELREMVLDLVIQQLLKEAPLEMRKIDAARAKAEQLVVEAS